MEILRLIDTFKVLERFISKIKSGTRFHSYLFFGNKVLTSQSFPQYFEKIVQSRSITFFLTIIFNICQLVFANIAYQQLCHEES